MFHTNLKPLVKTYLALFFLSTFGVLSECYSQDYNKGETLKSKGPIPVDFRTLSSKKYQAQSSIIQKSEKARIKKTKQQFLIESNFLIDRLLVSGKVLFNDPISQYVAQVADKITSKDKSLKDSLKFYVIKSPVVNALSTNQGYIMINLGLLAQLENEAQLAFVLCHEIVHFKRKHSLNKYIRLESKRGEVRKMSYEQQLLSKAAYSKENETQADMEGLDLFMKTEYSTAVLDGVFDVLEYGHLPYDEVDFSYKMFETENFKFRKEDILKEYQAISSDETEDTATSTHPSIQKRRVLIGDRISEAKKDPKAKKFVVSESLFVKNRQLARYELSKLYLEQRNYGASLYNSYLLLKEDPKSTYAKEQILYALYFMTKYKNRNSLSEVLPDHAEIQGKSQGLYHLLSKLSSEELNTMALVYGWKWRNESKSDVVADKLCKDLFKELVTRNNLTPESYYIGNMADLNKDKRKKSLDSLKAINTDNMSKYEKIKLSNASNAIAEEVRDTANITRYAFAEFYKDKDFLLYFNTAVNDKKQEEAEESSDMVKRAKRKERKKIERKGYALGVDKVVAVDPDFTRVDERKKNSVRYLDSEESQLDFKADIEEMKQQVGFNVDVLSPMALASTEIDRFNDHALLNGWINERFKHDFDYVSVYDRAITELATKNRTEHFSWMGAISYTEKKRGKVGIIAMSLTFPVFTPFAIAYALTPAHTTYYYCLVFNVKTGELEMEEINRIRMNDKDYVIKSNIYNSLVQMKSSRKK